MNCIKNPFKPLSKLAEIWNTAWKVAAERVSKKTLETVVVLLTMAVIFTTFFAMQGVFFFVLIYALLQ